MLITQHSLKGIFVLVLAFMCQTGFAGGETKKSPILDRVEVIYEVPENIEKLSIEELQAEKAVCVRDLSVIKEASDEPAVAKQKLLQTILKHDDKRLEIVNVIPELIDEYQINGEFRDSLLGYRQTFDVEIRNSRQHVHTLDDYKSYDFRFSAVYMSMMFKFTENPEFHARMAEDMKDPNTTIGKYRKDLDDSYAQVEHDKYLVQNIYSINELEQVIAIIDEEITKRRRAEL